MYIISLIFFSSPLKCFFFNHLKSVKFSVKGHTKIDAADLAGRP